MDDIGQQLKNARVRQDINRDMLARLTGLEVTTLTAIEEGTLDINLSTLYKLSDVLRCIFIIGDMSI